MASFFIHEESIASMGDYAGIPIAFEVDVALELSVVEGGMGGFQFVERKVPVPYIKDYDAITGNEPACWARKLDPATTALFVAEHAGQRVGSAVVALNASDGPLPAQADVAILWDIRVLPDLRRCGIAAALFASAERWARARACRSLVAETQNINVPACKFYLSQGCELGAIRRFAYPEFPGEIQLLWYKSWSGDAPGESAGR